MLHEHASAVRGNKGVGSHNLARTFFTIHEQWHLLLGHFQVLQICLRTLLHEHWVYRAFFPLCRKVWKMTFQKVPSACGLILQLPTAHTSPRKLYRNPWQNLATERKKPSVMLFSRAVTSTMMTASLSPRSDASSTRTGQGPSASPDKRREVVSPYSANCIQHYSTRTGRYLGKRFCKQFSESSQCLLG